MKNPHVVIIGGGFGGLNAAKALRKVPVQVTLIDRNNYHLFQPLLYQVATAGLSSTDIASPIRHILKKQKNIEVLMADVQRVDTNGQRVITRDFSYPYDYLILAPGARYNYFGHDDWEKSAPGLKTIPDAMEIRRKVLIAFEKAEMEMDSEQRQACLNFVIVGGGPTGTELAGSIGELANKCLAKDFRRINPASARILLVEAGPKILSSFSDELISRAVSKLEKLKVEVKTNTTVEKVEEGGVLINGKFLPAHTILWCAGVKASPLLESLGCELDKRGCVKVQPDLSIPGLDNIFVIGDAAHFEENGRPLPGLAPVAMQQGTHVGRVIRYKIEGKSVPAFKYNDKGQLATVGRGWALASVGKLRLSGFLGWLVWLFVHILYLIGFENRALVLFQWAWNFLSYDRGARVIPNKRKQHSLEDG